MHEHDQYMKSIKYEHEFTAMPILQLNIKQNYKYLVLQFKQKDIVLSMKVTLSSHMSVKLRE